MPTKPQNSIRPPVVAIVGHIDHGKSTLLDYIRKTNVVAGEAGGITQHLSAYEATHKNASGEHTITFLDTPGHEAFSAMRSRGLMAADVAILIVSAEEGAKPQTLEAAKLIEEAEVPYIVALTKIDKEAANVDRAKASLLEHGIYLEGLGGTIPSVAISSKTGQGVPELLDLILLQAELENLTADLAKPAQGVVIEAHVDTKRGTSATLIVKDGTLRAGEYVVSNEASAPIRIMENFLGKAVKEIAAGRPARIVGFSELPQVGSEFHSVAKKKDAEEEVRVAREERLRKNVPTARPKTAAAVEGEEEVVQPTVLPLVIKTDVAGAGDAVVHEIAKLPKLERLETRIIQKSVGSVSEADVKLAGSGEVPGIVLGFNVKVDGTAQALAERLGVTIRVFDIIYKLAEWLGTELENRRPRERIEERSGAAKVLKVFSQQKNHIVLGGRVEEGVLKDRAEVRIMRRDLELGRGPIESLQSQKQQVGSVEEGQEFGAMVKTDAAVAPGDKLEVYIVVLK